MLFEPGINPIRSNSYGPPSPDSDVAQLAPFARGVDRVPAQARICARLSDGQPLAAIHGQSSSWASEDARGTLWKTRRTSCGFPGRCGGACASAASAGSAGRIRPPHGCKNATTPVRPSTFSSGNKANTRNWTCSRSCCLTSRTASDCTRSIAYWSTGYLTGRFRQLSRSRAREGATPAWARAFATFVALGPGSLPPEPDPGTHGPWAQLPWTAPKRRAENAAAVGHGCD